MVNKFFNVACIFYSDLNSPSGIATCTALHAIRRFCRQYCSRTSNPDKYISFCIFRIFLIFSERGKELLHVTHMQSLMLHYLKGFLPPFVSGLQGIGFLFAVFKRGLDTAWKIEKIRENKNVLHAVNK
jgi:hypothetical protein